MSDKGKKRESLLSIIASASVSAKEVLADTHTYASLRLLMIIYKLSDFYENFYGADSFLSDIKNRIINNRGCFSIDRTRYEAFLDDLIFSIAEELENYGRVDNIDEFR